MGVKAAGNGSIPSTPFPLLERGNFFCEFFKLILAHSWWGLDKVNSMVYYIVDRTLKGGTRG